MKEAHRETVDLGEASIATARWGTGIPSIVMLHDGLGSIVQWRALPDLLARSTGRSVLAYDRPGHGESRPVPTTRWPDDWLRAQADLLADLLAHFGIEAPALVGHSDGGTIAFLYAAHVGRVEAIAAIASHTFVEPVAMDFIAGLLTDPRTVVAGLAAFHKDPEAVFQAWAGAWTSESLADFDIRPELGSINRPVLLIQGSEDEYATDEQAHTTAAALGPHATLELLAGKRHLVHHTDPDLVVGLIVDFLAAGAHA